MNREAERDGFAGEDTARALARLVPRAEPELLFVGEGTADVRLDMWGNLFDVSL